MDEASGVHRETLLSGNLSHTGTQENTAIRHVISDEKRDCWASLALPGSGAGPNRGTADQAGD